ncbi:MAG: glycosyltransferase [bacterium]
MSDNPRVSVCIASYNHARYLPDSIESVLNQTYTDFEVVIVDDGSTDGSLALAETYAARYPDRVRVFTHPNHSNRGISETVNLAYLKSRGEFWSGVPSDDALCPNKLEKQVAFLDSHPEVGWVYSYCEVTDESLHPMPGTQLFGKDITREAHPLHLQIQRNLIPGMSVLMRRSCTERVGLHEPGLVYSDWEFWLRMLVLCRPGFIAHPLVRYRVHSSNTSGDQVERDENLRRGIEVMKSIRAKAPTIGGELATPRSLALIELQLTYYCFCLGDEEEAQRRLSAAFHADPTLGGDGKFFTSWLRERLFESYHGSPANSRESGFIFWVARNLPQSVGRGLRRRALAAAWANEALGERDAGPHDVWQPALKCIIRDPTWLADGSLRLMLLNGLFGPEIVNRIRRVKGADRWPNLNA